MFMRVSKIGLISIYNSVYDFGKPPPEVRLRY